MNTVINEQIDFSTGECFLGIVLVARSARGVCAILIGDHEKALRRDLQAWFPSAKLVEGGNEIEQFVAKVAKFIASPTIGLDIALDVRGTAFERRVWEALQEIPAGSTVSYAEIARRLGEPGRAKEVSEACAANSLAVAIPCHRVVRKDGGLAGYRWGVKRKRALLEREGARVADAAPRGHRRSRREKVAGAPDLFGAAR